MCVNFRVHLGHEGHVSGEKGNGRFPSGAHLFFLLVSNFPFYWRLL